MPAPFFSSLRSAAPNEACNDTPRPVFRGCAVHARLRDRTPIQISQCRTAAYDTTLRACPKTVGDWLILPSLRSKMCLSPSPREVLGQALTGRDALGNQPGGILMPATLQAVENRRNGKQRTGRPRFQQPQAPSERAHNARQLADRCLLGDQEAWRHLVEMYEPVCRRRAGEVLSEQAASFALDDAIQNAYLAVLANLHTWQGHSHESLAAWFGMIAKREAIHCAEALRRWSQDREECVSETDEAARRYANRRRQREVLDLIEDLNRKSPERQRAVLRELFQGKSQTEIAASIGVSERTVRTDITRMRDRLASVRKTAQEKRKFVSGKPRVEPSISVGAN